MKMEMPKMDVVRFQEADVLAASGDGYIQSRIAQAGGANENIVYTILPVGDVESVHGYSDLLKDSNTAYSANPSFTRGNQTTRLRDLVHDDEPTTSEANLTGGDLGAWFNGLYESHDYGNTYTWINQ